MGIKQQPSHRVAVRIRWTQTCVLFIHSLSLSPSPLHTVLWGWWFSPYIFQTPRCWGLPLDPACERHWKELRRRREGGEGTPPASVPVRSGGRRRGRQMLLSAPHLLSSTNAVGWVALGGPGASRPTSSQRAEYQPCGAPSLMGISGKIQASAVWDAPRSS